MIPESTIIGNKNLQSNISLRPQGLAVSSGDCLGFSENALRVLAARYLKKDEAGQRTETLPELFRRVARCVAGVELLYSPAPENRSKWEERFYDLMVSRRFMPNSPTLMNAGREMGMLSACFVLPVGDSIDEIFDSIKHTALIQKAGGGTGFAFDQLRPTGDYISTSGGTTSGPISFWRAFSEATNAIQQGAFRRGANMGMMNIEHPDILKFLYAKEDLDQFTNYNISVKITDEWMDGFITESGAVHVVVNPRTGRRYVLPKNLKIWEYDLRSLVEVTDESGQSVAAGVADASVESTRATGEFYTRQDIWDIIIKNAHRTGEPGIVFIDRINADNPTPHIGSMQATNPCGEQPLLPYEACNLGSINLAEFVIENEDARAARVDWDALRETVYESTRFLDNVIDANKYPLPQIDRICKGNRKIGLGIMGFADALYLLGVPYNSEEGLAWGERFMRFVHEESHRCSEQLAHERGSFPNWKDSIYDRIYHRPMRNATCTTVAPTGTISIIAGCSGGIEPLFSLAFFRNVLREAKKDQAAVVEINRIFEQVAKKHGFLSEGLMEHLATDGTLAHIDEKIPSEIRRVFVCAHDISAQWHVRMQAAFQKHCDASISKTINFPEQATPDDVETIYRQAYALGCKGVTVYRNGCRKHQPMALKNSEKSNEQETFLGVASNDGGTDNAHLSLEPAVLPELSSGIRMRQMTPFGNMHINITVDPKSEREMEVFAQLGKGGDIANSDLEAICRLISLWLRSGGSLEHVIRQLHSIGSSLQVSTKEGRIMSLGDGLARALQKYTRAKDEIGLRSLLLGEGRDKSSGNTKKNPEVNGHDSSTKGSNGNSGANGNGSNNNGHGPAKTVACGLETLPNRSRSPYPAERFGIHWQQAKYKVVCPDCHEMLRFSEGCTICDSCGNSYC